MLDVKNNCVCQTVRWCQITFRSSYLCNGCSNDMTMSFVNTFHSRVIVRWYFERSFKISTVFRYSLKCNVLYPYCFSNIKAALFRLQKKLRPCNRTLFRCTDAGVYRSGLFSKEISLFHYAY